MEAMSRSTVTLSQCVAGSRAPQGRRPTAAVQAGTSGAPDASMADPTITAATREATMAAQALIVNGRPVSDPVLRTAVRVAYRDVIAFGRHPIVALFLTLDPEQLDVNVHPAKAEVRFRSPEAVRGLVISTLSRALAAGAAGVAAP